MLVNLLILSWLFFTSTQAQYSPNFLYAWTPLLLLPLLHRNTALSTRAISNKKYDERLIQFEERFFSPVMHFHRREALSYLLLSEYLHACYLSFYLLIYCIPLYFYLRQSLHAFYESSFAILLSLCTCFVAHAFFPVDGPRNIFAKIKDQRSQGLFFKYVHFILERGSTEGTAFPSGHTALASIVILITWHLSPMLCLWITPIAVGIILSTIYGRFHYVIDLVFGVLCALMSYVVTVYLYD